MDIWQGLLIVLALALLGGCAGIVLYWLIVRQLHDTARAMQEGLQRVATGVARLESNLTELLRSQRDLQDLLQTTSGHLGKASGRVSLGEPRQIESSHEPQGSSDSSGQIMSGVGGVGDDQHSPAESPEQIPADSLAPLTEVAMQAFVDRYNEARVSPQLRTPILARYQPMRVGVANAEKRRISPSTPVCWATASDGDYLAFRV